MKKHNFPKWAAIPSGTHYACESAGIAQTVEQAICNRHVRGSSPRIGLLSISTDSAMDNESEAQ